MEILQIPFLEDNYAYILHDRISNATAVVDPGACDVILQALQQHRWQLTHILNTHHHADHVGGNLALKAATGCRVYGFRQDSHRIPGLDYMLDDGDTVSIGNINAEVIFVPGHTTGHIAYWFKDEKALFCGDTLFSLGCGRLFEGTPEIMWAALLRLRALPEDTRVFCAHEYTKANARFALEIDSGNSALVERVAKVERLRAQSLPTVPSLLGDEVACNPFLRADDPAIKNRMDLADAPASAVFAALRELKNNFI